jgi:hypothetical protein
MREALEISEGQWLVGHGGSLSSRVPRRLGSLSLPALRVSEFSCPLVSLVILTLLGIIGSSVFDGPLLHFVYPGLFLFSWSSRMARRPLFQHHFDAW